MENSKLYFKSATELKKEMVNTAMSVMTGYYSDIVYDLERVDKIAQEKHDDWFYWVVRKTGTHMRDTNKEFDELLEDLGKDALVAALVGRCAKDDTFEILYTKKGGEE